MFQTRVVAGGRVRSKYMLKIEKTCLWKDWMHSGRDSREVSRMTPILWPEHLSVEFPFTLMEKTL